jgi:hypothetical protein
MRNSAKPAIAGLPGYSRSHAACATGNGLEMRALHVSHAGVARVPLLKLRKPRPLAVVMY